MRKVDRQRLIKQLVKERPIQKQEEFVEILHAQGIEVTQATISRDIKEMQLIKVSSDEGFFHYSLSSQKSKADRTKLNKMLQEAAINLEQMDKYIALKTVPGSAVALGMLAEKIYSKELFTIITTDDKVLMIFKLEEEAKLIQDELRPLVYG